MIDKNIDISFITVNYNGLKDTRELIISIYDKIKSITFEIIVVDNASKSNESDALALEFKEAICIRSEINLGFAGGNNLGIKVSKGRYIMLINNDTLVIDDSVSNLVKFMDSKTQVGCASPKILFHKPANVIQYAGSTMLSRFSIRNKLIGFGEEDFGQHNFLYKTPFTHGAAMIIRREVIEKVGPMPEIFFLYYEEMDWCTKISNAGYEQWYVPDATIIHKESQSTGQGSYLRNFYMTRNRLLYAWRNREGAGRALSIIYQISVAIPKSIFVSIFKGRFDLVKASLQAIFAFFNIKDKNA